MGGDYTVRRVVRLENSGKILVFNQGKVILELSIHIFKVLLI